MIKDTGLLLGRVLLGVIFVNSGFGKLMHLEAFGQSLAGRGVPMSGPLSVLGALVEVLGGIAIALFLGVSYLAVQQHATVARQHHRVLAHADADG